MQLQLEIIKVSKPEKKPSKGGGYEVLEVTYKDLTGGGKIAGKKLFSFGDYAHVFEAAKSWNEEQVINIQSEKLPGSDGKEYWTWVNVLESVSSLVDPEIAPGVKQSDVPAITKPTSKQQWVPDEVRQRLIVRQSCLAQAVAYEKENSATLLNVLDTAETFVSWVFEAAAQQVAMAEAPAKRGRPKKVEAIEVE